MPAGSGATWRCCGNRHKAKRHYERRRRAEQEVVRCVSYPFRLYSSPWLCSACGVSACRDSGGEGEYFALGGKIFVFNYRVATATYLVNLRPLQPVEDGQTAVVSFEDPAGGAPHRGAPEDLTET